MRLCDILRRHLCHFFHALGGGRGWRGQCFGVQCCERKGGDFDIQFELRYLPSEVHISESIDTLRYSRTEFMSFRVDLLSELIKSCIIDTSFCLRGVGDQSPFTFIYSSVFIRKSTKDWIQGAYT